ncbi:hypothetical protein EVJ50_03955 [Synechococcus sp. RSCCF101]|nr:hypothetical protein EVJ50_03955 [Synechococcus sp. RSCCF101]
MMRTDATAAGANLTPNLAEADVIKDYDVTSDYLVLPGVSSLADLVVVANGANTVLGVNDGGLQIAALVEGVAPGAIDPGRLIVGTLADQILASANPGSFAGAPDLIDSFGLV